MRRELLMVVLVLVSCDSATNSGSPPPGYDGPCPSGIAQEVFKKEKETLRFKDDGGREWEIGAFAVVPNPVSRGGKGPVVSVRHEGQERWLAVECDGDVAELYRRIYGVSSATLKGKPSQAFQDSWRQLR